MLCEACKEVIAAEAHFCQKCGKPVVRAEVPKAATQLPSKGRLVLRIFGLIAIFLVLLFVSASISRRFGLAMAENAGTATIALIIGYYLHPKRRRSLLSNTGHFVSFAGFMPVATILREMVVPLGQDIPNEYRGALFIVEVVVGWSAYFLAMREWKTRRL